MKRIHVLYTGGTIGCAGEPLRPLSGADFAAQLQAVPGFANQQLDGEDIAWVLTGCDRPLDSATMQPADWVRIAATQLALCEDYDGFVVLHGTDTLAWTAAALSILLAGFPKPVVLTGSQRPLADENSDAPANLRLAIRRAASAAGGEFSVAFGGALLHAARVVKIDSLADAAFASPGVPPLDMAPPEANTHAWAQENLALRLARVEEGVSRACVRVLYLFPGIDVALLEAALAPPAMGLVLAAYGAGNAPDSDDFIACLRRARQRGVVIVGVTQALQGGVRLSAYQTGARLAGAGVINGGDMTPAAACAKLVVLHALGLGCEKLEALMQQNLAGELKG